MAESLRDRLSRVPPDVPISSPILLSCWFNVHVYYVPSSSSSSSCYRDACTTYLYSAPLFRIPTPRRSRSRSGRLRRVERRARSVYVNKKKKGEQKMVDATMVLSIASHRDDAIPLCFASYARDTFDISILPYDFISPSFKCVKRRRS